MCDVYCDATRYVSTWVSAHPVSDDGYPVFRRQGERVFVPLPDSSDVRRTGDEERVGQVGGLVGAGWWCLMGRKVKRTEVL